MAKKGNEFRKYSPEFKTKILEKYRTGDSGGHYSLSKKYGVPDSTIRSWITIKRKGGSVIE